MKTAFKGILAALACGLVGTAGYAAVTVDDEGIGFVGKGDVQLAFGLNNAQMQATNPTGYTFSWTSSEQVSWECEKTVETRTC